MRVGVRSPDPVNCVDLPANLAVLQVDMAVFYTAVLQPILWVSSVLRCSDGDKDVGSDDNCSWHHGCHGYNHRSGS